MDNTVAGGIPSGMSVFESLVKECMEEASMPDGIVREYVRAVGAVSYFFRFAAKFIWTNTFLMIRFILQDLERVAAT